MTPTTNSPPIFLSSIFLSETASVPALSARGLSKKFVGRPVFAEVDLAVAAGEIVALLGANGAGKTTLLHCLAGRLRPTAGEVLWHGQSPRQSPALHRQIGLASHESFLYPELTARENLTFAARMQGVADAARRVAELLAAVRLEDQAGQIAGRLSKGQRQRLSLARALVHDPPIVILDEPFSGLDAAGREWLERWLDDLRTRQRAVCFTSHDAALCRRVADRRLELCGGRLLALPPRLSQSVQEANSMALAWSA